MINLCSRRLSIVDLQTGSQPIHNEDKGLLKFYYQDPDKNVGVSSLIWSLIMFQNWCNIYM